MKKGFTLLVLLFVFGLTYGKRISENSAKRVGQTFLTSSSESFRLKGSPDLQLAYTSE